MNDQGSVVLQYTPLVVCPSRKRSLRFLLTFFFTSYHSTISFSCSTIKRKFSQRWSELYEIEVKQEKNYFLFGERVEKTFSLESMKTLSSVLQRTGWLLFNSVNSVAFFLLVLMVDDVVGGRSAVVLYWVRTPGSDFPLTQTVRQRNYNSLLLQTKEEMDKTAQHLICILYHNSDLAQLHALQHHYPLAKRKKKQENSQKRQVRLCVCMKKSCHFCSLQREASIFFQPTRSFSSSSSKSQTSAYPCNDMTPTVCTHHSRNGSCQREVLKMT